MAKFIKQDVDLDSVVSYREDAENSLRHYYASSAANPRFVGYSLPEVQEELTERLAELNLTSTLILLSAIEAAFRVDYALRCYRGPVDRLSEAFRKLNKKKKAKVNLEKEILGAWRSETNIDEKLVGSLRGAFRLRHWIAHGRYWDPKLGQKYDFFSIQALASDVFSQFPFFKP